MRMPGSVRSLLLSCATLVILACGSAPVALAVPSAPTLAPSFRPGGEPLILAPDGHGGIWYGGAATYVSGEEDEPAATVWHIAARGGVTRFQLPTTPKDRFAEYFVHGPDGSEWFLQPHGCVVPSPFRALHRSRSLVVWRVTVLAPGDEGSRETYFACEPGRRKAVRRVAFAEPELLAGGDTVERLAYGGHYLAYVTSSGDKFGGTEDLVVENVATGRSTGTVTDNIGGSPELEQVPDLERSGAPIGRGVFDLAVAADGAVAWVGHSRAVSATPSVSVLYVRDAGVIRRLAAAGRIAGLRFAGTTLEWQEDGRARSAPA